MAIYRVPKEKGFTQISNKIIESKELSVQEKWCLLFCLSRSDNWVFNIRGMAHYSREKTDMIRSAVKGLEEKGYIVRRRERINGKLGRMIYDIYENPCLNPAYSAKARPGQDNSVQAKPVTDMPGQDTAQVYNTNQNNTKKNNIYHTNHQSINQNAEIENQIRRQIEYNIMCTRYDSRLLDDLVAVMVSVMVEQADTIAISKIKVMPADYVRECISKINPLHIEQIMDTLQTHQPVVRNMHGYLLTALINAANTMSMSYQYGDY